MIKLKYNLTIICFIITALSPGSFAQSEGLNDDVWKSVKASAHRIGFCIYRIEQDICTEHSEIKAELEKISDPDADVFYFALDASWAKERVSAWAKSNETTPDNYFMLFDIDQRSIRQLYDSTKTSNSYMMFSILDLRDQYTMVNSSRSNFEITCRIRSNRPNSILSNAMWREFMSNRTGRLENEIRISLNGPNSKEDYLGFEEAFTKLLNR